MPGPSQFEPPVAVEVSAACTVLCWTSPRTNGNKTFAEHTTWDYRVEYNCSCRMHQQPYAMSTTETHALLATPHTGETYYVRVVARATFAGAMAGLVSAKTSFVAKATETAPWLSSAPSPCIFDGLYLSAANSCESAAGIAAMCSSRQTPTREHACRLDENVTSHVLDTDSEFRLFRAVYDYAVAPVRKRTIFYLVATGRRSNASPRLRSREIEALLLRDDAGLVLCGVSDAGRVAVRAAHALLSSLMTSNPPLSYVVFCITYGTPRSLLKDAAQLLAHTLPRSHHFLHVTQLPLKDNRASPDADVAISTRCAGRSAVAPPLRLTGYAEGFYRNTLLGAQCSVAYLGDDHNLRSARQGGTEKLRGLQFCGAQPALPLTTEEECETFDVAAQLRRLAVQFFPSTPSWLAPAITSLQCRTTGLLLYTTMEGHNLQFCPRLTVLAPGHVATFPRVASCEPHRLCCVSALLPWIATCATAPAGAPAAALSLSLCVLVQTTFGTQAARPSNTVALPRDVVDLFQWCAAATVAPWATAAPLALLECALQIQPLYALSSQTARAVDEGSTAMAVPLTEVLCAMASAAEAAAAEKARAGGVGNTATANSVFGFMSDVAARFSAAVSAGSTDGNQRLSVPTKEAAFLRNALKEWVANTSTGIDVWRMRSASWKQRIGHSLSSLGDGAYRDHLCRLLRHFDRHFNDSSAESVPYLWLEAELYTHVWLHVCAPLANSQATMEGPLCASITLADFYPAVVDVFAGESALSPPPTTASPPLPYVEEVMLLWCTCQCFELRRELARTQFCCVVGCAGCGGTTLANSIKAVLHSSSFLTHPRQQERRRRFVVCRVAACRLSALFLAAQSGVPIVVFIAGELADLERPPYAALSVRVQESLVYAHQHWIHVITKADEHFRRVRAPPQAASAHFSPQSVLEQTTRDVLGSNPLEEHRLLVSLAPSPSRIAQIVQCNSDDASAFASELIAVSHHAISKYLSIIFNQTCEMIQT